MKKFILFVGIILLGLTSLVSQLHAFALVNYLENPSFENGLNSWVTGGPNWQAQSAVTYDGTIAARNTIGTIPGLDYFANLHQDIPFSPGQAAWATVQAKTAINVQSSARAGLLIQFLNGSNVVLASAQDETGGLSNWRQLHVKLVAPPGTVKARYNLFVFATQAETTPPNGIAIGGLVYFDAAFLINRPLASPPPQTFINNPGFENGLVDWEQIFAPALSVDNQNPAVGSYSGKNTITVNNQQDFFASAYQDLDYQSGPVYGAAKIRTAMNPVSSATAGLKLEFYNIFNPPPGTQPLGSVQSTLVGNNPWTNVVLNGGNGITPPPGTQMIRVLTFTFAVQNDASANGSNANFDEVVLSYTPLPPQNPTNILNAGFENGLNSWSDLFGFPSTVSNVAHGGLFSAQKSIGALLPPQNYFSQIYQDIYFNEGATPYPLNTPVYATAYLKTQIHPVTKSQAGLQFEFIDSNGQVIRDGANQPIVVRDLIGGNTNWRYVYVSALTPPGTVRVRTSGTLFARQSDVSFGGNGFYDDFAFSKNTPLPPPAPQTVLLNPGFENGLNDWDELFKPGEVSTNIKYTGNYAAVFTYDNSVLTQDFFGTASQRLAVSVGNTVTAKGYVKTNIDPITAGTAGISVRFFNSVGQQIGPTFSQAIGGITNWTQLQLSRIAPKGSQTVEFAFYIFGPAGQANPGDQAFFDAAQVTIK